MNFSGGVFLERRVVVAWLTLAAVLFALAIPLTQAPGVDYDEALFGHLSKDFLTGRHCADHIPSSKMIDIMGHPFPLFVQNYLGALKCWMLLPSFVCFGTTTAVMRLTMLAWGLVGLLLLMLWTRRVLGFAAAVLVGFLVGLDPAFFFPTVCEWGAFVPSMICRCAGMLFLTIWWTDRRVRWMILTGVTFGLGFFNKIDFAHLMVAMTAGVLAAKRKELFQAVVKEWRQIGIAFIAFVITALPMLISLAKSFGDLADTGFQSGEMTVKLNTARALFDGTYFYRLMDKGGRFHPMFDGPAPFVTPFGIVFAVVLVLFVIKFLWDWRNGRVHGLPVFILVTLICTSFAILWQPQAVRIHHTLHIYPYPQLIIASMALLAWTARDLKPLWRGVGKVLVIVAVGSILAGHVFAIWKTEELTTRTGGKGEWSKAIESFADEVKKDPNRMVFSLDWGFHEQLSFLTDSTRLRQPIWFMEGKMIRLPHETNCFYLLHPPQYTVFLDGPLYYAEAQKAGPQVAIDNYTNRVGEVTFYSYHYLKP